MDGNAGWMWGDWRQKWLHSASLFGIIGLRSSASSLVLSFLIRDLTAHVLEDRGAVAAGGATWGAV